MWPWRVRITASWNGDRPRDGELLRRTQEPGESRPCRERRRRQPGRRRRGTPRRTPLQAGVAPPSRGRPPSRRGPPARSPCPRSARHPRSRPANPTSSRRRDWRRRSGAGYECISLAAMRVEPQLRTDPHLADVEAVPGEDQWETSGFHCRELGPDTYALTYTLRQAERLTRRLTLWRLIHSGWKVLYHQGTIIEPDQAGSPLG